MKTVDISTEENAIYQTLQEGHPVQVRVPISPGDESNYDKGTKVKVLYQNEEVEAKIVSQPLEIDSKREDGQKTFSLVLEKP
jgi:hypothetical protein